MPKPNYSFAKRQRELEKKRKKEEKVAAKRNGPADAGNNAPQPADPPPDTEQKQA